MKGNSFIYEMALSFSLERKAIHIFFFRFLFSNMYIYTTLNIYNWIFKTVANYYHGIDNSLLYEFWVCEQCLWFKPVGDITFLVKPCFSKDVTNIEPISFIDGVDNTVHRYPCSILDNKWCWINSLILCGRGVIHKNRNILWKHCSNTIIPNGLRDDDGDQYCSWSLFDGVIHPVINL